MRSHARSTRRRLAAVAAILSAVGLATVVWYAAWGVHGCDDWGGNPMCERMDRDYRAYLIGLGSLASGLVLAGFAALGKTRGPS
jgi:hypothetical protein